MKLIRLTDDRFVLDGGSEVRADQMAAITEWWKEWWERNPGSVPEVAVFGGSATPLEYEDRREPDIESRLRFLESHVHIIATHDEGWEVMSGPPLSQPPLSRE